MEIKKEHGKLLQDFHHYSSKKNLNKLADYEKISTFVKQMLQANSYVVCCISSSIVATIALHIWKALALIFAPRNRQFLIVQTELSDTPTPTAWAILVRLHGCLAVP